MAVNRCVQGLQDQSLVPAVWELLHTADLDTIMTVFIHRYSGFDAISRAYLEAH